MSLSPPVALWWSRGGKWKVNSIEEYLNATPLPHYQVKRVTSVPNHFEGSPTTQGKPTIVVPPKDFLPPVPTTHHVMQTIDHEDAKRPCHRVMAESPGRIVNNMGLTPSPPLPQPLRSRVASSVRCPACPLNQSRLTCSAPGIVPGKTSQNCADPTPAWAPSRHSISSIPRAHPQMGWFPGSDAGTGG